MASLLIEIGAEELPPKALEGMSAQFEERLLSALNEARLSYGASERFATPRRLAVLVRELDAAQAERQVEKRGPPVKVAFDSDGNPTKAAEKFAQGCGVSVDALERIATPKGEWLVWRSLEAGRSGAEVISECLPSVVDGIAVPRRMRWGSSSYSFSRPVRWLLALLDDKVIEGCEVLGCQAGRRSYGHRFHGPAEGVMVSDALAYRDIMREHSVIASFAERRDQVAQAISETARDAGATALVDEALLDEVTALVELPVPVLAGFEEKYLALPREVIIATLQEHQRYFPLTEADGSLRNAFITIANLRSTQPEEVRRGNERVVEPRLADAAFFWESDGQHSLEARRGDLDKVVFQRELGTLADKTSRLEAMARHCCDALGEDAEDAVRAASLAKADLLTDMVGEFPELQGVMGGHYARRDGERQCVATAIAEHYLPRFAGDVLPASSAGRALALADRLDTLTGYFAIGSRPTGNKDPFGLRRCALGILRVLIEGELDLDLRELLAAALALQPVSPAKGSEEVLQTLEDFLFERLRGYYAADGGATSALEETGEAEASATAQSVFDAVLALRPRRPLDFHRRICAVREFVTLDAAVALAAANKRISNILRQAGDLPADVEPSLFESDAERALSAAVDGLRGEVESALEAGRYTAALTRLADLREPVDAFFDDVMVMVDDEEVRNNRLALLASVQRLFVRTADIALLQLG